jgi:hypothetical protein
VSKRSLSIGIDLDGVVFDFITPFLYFFNDYFHGTYPERHLMEWKQFHPSDSKFCTLDEERAVFEVFENSGGYLTLPVIPGTKLALSQLARDGHMITYITSRPIFVYGDTEQSLRANGLQTLGLYQCPMAYSDRGSMKWEICKNSNIDVMIDDRIEYLWEIKKNSPNTKTILFRHQINLDIIKKPPYDPDWIAYKWSDILDYIKRL